MASKKGASTTSNTKDSAGKRLGLKKSGGQMVYKGNIIIRQRGNTYHGSKGTHTGKDYTIMASKDGIVMFYKARRNPYAKVKTTYVKVVEIAQK